MEISDDDPVAPFSMNNESPATVSTRISKFKKLTAYENMLVMVQRLIRDLNNEDINLSKFRDALNDFNKTVLHEVHESERIFIELISYIEGENKFLTHCLNTVIFSAVLCHYLKIEKKKVVSVLSAALLHDVGKLSFKEKIREKFISREDDSADIRGKHPLWAKKLVIYHLHLPADIADMIAQHHAVPDGGGSQARAAAEPLDVYVQVLMAANFMESVLRAINYNGISSFASEMQKALKKNPLLFDPEVKRAINDALGMQEELRQHRRFIVGKEGFIEPQFSKMQYPCTVIDISAGGAKITTDYMLRMEDFFKINLSLSSNLFIKDRYCKIIWMRKGKKHNEYGLRFHMPDEGLIENIKPVLDGTQQ